METYDPLETPGMEEWLELDESERILLVEEYHRRKRIKLPQPHLHAVIHCIVETQLAMADPAVCGALDRLQHEGCDRHDAIHAIGSVLADQMHTLLQPGAPAAAQVNERYCKALEGLTAKKWRESR